MWISQTHGYTCLGDGHWTGRLWRMLLFGKGHHARVSDSHRKQGLQTLQPFAGNFHPSESANYWSRCLYWLRFFEKYLYAYVFRVWCGRSFRWKCRGFHNPIWGWQLWSKPDAFLGMEAEKNAIDIQILATVFASCLEFAERLWMKVSRMLCDWRAKKLHPFAVVFCWFSHIWSLESHIAQWVSHCYSSSTCITFQVVPLDVSFQVCFMSMAVWCFSYTWMCVFFEVGARRARRVICGTDPRKHMLINFDVLCRWCLTYITFCLGTMQLCHIDGWWTLLCSGLFGSARCLPLVVRCGAGERAPRFFWCGKKALRFLDFFFRDDIS